MNRDKMLSVSAMVRPMLKDLEFFERLELCGTWTLIECLDANCADESIAEMFDMMKLRMLRQIPIFRQGEEVAQLMRDAVDEVIVKTRGNP